jgi:hypothetical protein
MLANDLLTISGISHTAQKRKSGQLFILFLTASIIIVQLFSAFPPGNVWEVSGPLPLSRTYGTQKVFSQQKRVIGPWYSEKR